MNKAEADKFLMAIDGLAANLETLRNLVISSIEPEANKSLLEMIPDEGCKHENLRELATMNASNSMCIQCGELLE